MISGVLLIFGLPMILAALLISPSGLHNLVHCVPLYAGLGLVLPVRSVADLSLDARFPVIGN
jgi:hypothetical protein